MDSSQSTESFRSLLLRDRGLSGLSQRDLAARLGAGRRTVQDWEAGLSYPSAERLQSLIQALLEAGGLMAGREAAEAQQLWAAVLREAPRMHTPFDEVWLARLLADRGVAVARLAEAGMPAGVSMAEQGPIERDQDWGAAPDVLGFVGRTEELATLREWVLEARLRLAAVLGMGGIGKTVLAARLAQDIAPNFQRLYWRSLRDAPSISDWLAGAIGFLSGQQLLAPEGESAQLRVLLELLREQSSLLVLDNFETVLEPGDSEGRYRDGYEGYGRLLQAMGEGRHQSCLLVTSREAPAELAKLRGSAVRTLQLGGLGAAEAQALLADKRLSGNTDEWASLVDRFGGNGLALKVVGDRIRELFGGELSMFLSEAGSGRVFGGIRRLLIEQLERSSGLEQKVLRVLAVEREPVTLAELLADLGVRVRRGAVLEAVEALRRRSLVERAEVSGPAAFTLQSVVLEYVTDRLVDEACGEITAGRPALLVDQPLIKAQAKDYVRQSQERLIGSPILQQLKARHDERGTADRLVALLDHWRGQPFDEQGYGPGNIVNLLRLLRGDLRGLDFSRLAIRQGYLAEVDAQDASLVDAYGGETVLAEAFHFPVCVAVSADGALLAAGTSTGAVCVWRVTDRTPLWVAAHAHAGTIRGVAFSRDGQLVATGGEDGTMRLWAALTGRPSATLPNDTGTIGGVALSADGHLLAGGSGDGTVRLWEDAFPARDPSEQTAERINQADKSPAAPPNEWRALAPLRGHTGAVWSVGLSADSRLVVSGGDDGTVRVWEARTGRPLATLQGHTGTVWGVALSADGQLVVSGGGDGTVRLWEARTGRPLATLQGHTGTVWGVATSADGQLVISAGADATLRMWSAGTARPLATLQGYSGTVWCVGLSDDGHRVVSGDGDGTLRLWEPGSPRPLASVHGHTGTVWGLAVSADGRLVVSGGEDGMVHLWEVAFAGSDRTDQSAENPAA